MGGRAFSFAGQVFVAHGTSPVLRQMPLSILLSLSFGSTAITAAHKQALPEDDEDEDGQTLTRLTRRYSDVHHDSHHKLSDREGDGGGDRGDHLLTSAVDGRRISVAAGALIKLQNNINLRRATSETGVELSSSIHASKRAKKELEAARAAARERKGSQSGAASPGGGAMAASIGPGVMLGGTGDDDSVPLPGTSGHSRNGKPPTGR
ncbi:unnamed protein product [Phaeothamnion confervicola]